MRDESEKVARNSQEQYRQGIHLVKDAGHSAEAFQTLSDRTESNEIKFFSIVQAEEVANKSRMVWLAGGAIPRSPCFQILHFKVT